VALQLWYPRSSMRMTGAAARLKRGRRRSILSTAPELLVARRGGLLRMTSCRTEGAHAVTQVQLEQWHLGGVRGRGRGLGLGSGVTGRDGGSLTSLRFRSGSGTWSGLG
jgi:hypothetical protein